MRRHSVNHDHAESEHLSTSACWGLLRRSDVGRMALHGDDDEIEIFPLNFIVDRESIVFKTAAGTKLALVSGHRRAAFEVDAFDFYEGTAWSVVLRGVPTVLRHDDEVLAELEQQIRPWQVGNKPAYVRLAPDVVTGRRFRVDPNHKDVHR